MASPWLTPQQAAEHLGVTSERAVVRLATEHGLPYHRMGGRYRFHVAELDRWLLRTGSGAGEHVPERAAV